MKKPTGGGPSAPPPARGDGNCPALRGCFYRRGVRVSGSSGAVGGVAGRRQLLQLQAKPTALQFPNLTAAPKSEPTALASALVRMVTCPCGICVWAGPADLRGVGCRRRALLPGSAGNSGYRQVSGFDAHWASGGRYSPACDGPDPARRGGRGSGPHLKWPPADVAVPLPLPFL